MKVALVLLLCLAGCAHGPAARVTLLPQQEEGSAVTITTGQDAQTLRTPLSSADVTRRGLTIAPLSPDVFQSLYGPVVAGLPTAGQRLTLYFQTGGSVLTPESQAVMQELLAMLAQREAVEVEIAGFTDTVGTLEDNDRLSLNRASAMRDILARAGMRAGLVRIVGRGERELSTPTPDETPEPNNRRVVITVR